mgnify:CR=1 FL=1
MYVAGGMKRDQPELSEDKVLLQALRDFNLGKLTADDHGIFMGLLNDLFPKMLDLVPRLRDMPFEEQIVKSAVELGTYWAFRTKSWPPCLPILVPEGTITSDCLSIHRDIHD